MKYTYSSFRGKRKTKTKDCNELTFLLLITVYFVAFTGRGLLQSISASGRLRCLVVALAVPTIYNILSQF